ncbi:serine hydrolase domain-containing protein [Bradyrhizobium sp. SZCCHNR3015]|uniref:serine hydrolase domain-containing protein n=1 Tax=Bradyrhizobium sp. SZCCHNR3015 TaxID=3057395 RepID=UPI0029166F90|nr:serine hydrolase domain-containing protein [Bradyrhizobium sp. SZCCHNR3015]
MVGLAHAEPPVTSARHFNSQALQRVDDYFRHEVATAKIPGAVVLIQQHGQPVFLKSFGMRNAASAAPMTLDTIFRLYSMSKPITSVAAMMLVDDGRLRLDDLVSKYIPAFADVKVALAARDGKTVQSLQPPARSITIEDLLRHTSGITYGFYGETAVRKLYGSSDLFEGDIDNATFADRLAKLPLAEQPGTVWDYGHSVDVLGRVIEVVSGQMLYQFEKEKLLDPLGMLDTAFSLTDPEKRGRVVEPLPQDRFDGPIAGLDDPVRPRRWESGGAGMTGTIGDYARFVQMLLNGGTFDGRRYLKAETVASMTRDHLGPEIAHDDFYHPGPDSGFGLGFAVRVSAAPPFTAGEYRWDGVGGTFFFVDPKDDMFAVVMMQSPLQRGRIETEVRRLIYQALAP